MINKFQQGGQMDQQQQALVQFIQGIAQVAQVDPQQVMQLAQQEPERLETAVQVFQQTQDIQQAAQAFFQKEAQSAKKGAKLNYLKRLSGKCPEGQQLVYFKSGGQICSKCMAKKQQGDIIEEDKCGSKMKKKKGCGGFKINKSQGGSNSNEFLTDYSKPNIRTTMKLPSGKIIKKKLTEGQKEGEDRITIDGTNYYLRGDSTLVKSTNPNEIKSFKQLRKEKKKFGGNLKRVPFKQIGGNFDYFSVYQPNKNYWNWKNKNNIKSTLEVSHQSPSNSKKGLEGWKQNFNTQQWFNKNFDKSSVTLFEPGGNFKASIRGGGGYKGGFNRYRQQTETGSNFQRTKLYIPGDTITREIRDREFELGNPDTIYFMSNNSPHSKYPFYREFVSDKAYENAEEKYNNAQNTIRRRAGGVR